MLRHADSALRTALRAGAGAGTHSLQQFTRGLAVPKHRVYPQWKSLPPQHQLWRPNSWLGAYYKLREGDEVAMRNCERLRGKRAPTRGNFIVSALERVERDKLEAKDAWRAATWRPGDFLEVEHRAKPDETPDKVGGVLLGIFRRGLGSSFKLLSNVDGVAIEYAFQLYSPLVVNVSVRRDSEWRDGKRKLFALREMVHKLSFPKPSRRGESAAVAAPRKGRR
jgi:ribosomal protein L19